MGFTGISSYQVAFPKPSPLQYSLRPKKRRAPRMLRTPGEALDRPNIESRGRIYENYSSSFAVGKLPDSQNQPKLPNYFKLAQYMEKLFGKAVRQRGGSSLRGGAL